MLLARKCIHWIVNTQFGNYMTHENTRQASNHADHKGGPRVVHIAAGTYSHLDTTNVKTFRTLDWFAVSIIFQ